MVGGAQAGSPSNAGRNKLRVNRVRVVWRSLVGSLSRSQQIKPRSSSGGRGSFFRCGSCGGKQDVWMPPLSGDETVNDTSLEQRYEGSQRQERCRKIWRGGERVWRQTQSLRKPAFVKRLLAEENRTTISSREWPRVRRMGSPRLIT